MRLDKYICKSTEYSLVQAKALIEKSTVCINGLISTNISEQVHKNNTVAIAGKVIVLRSFRYLLLNKPAEMICSNVDEKHPSIFKLLDIDRKTELHFECSRLKIGNQPRKLALWIWICFFVSAITGVSFSTKH